MSRNKELDDLCDTLQKNAMYKQSAEINKINSYHQGYTQACEDFLRGAQGIIQKVGGKSE